MKSSAELLWSIVTIDINDAENTHDIEKCFEITRIFEKKYSRFIPGNYLDIINTNKSSDIDAEFFSIVNLCLKVSEMTQWYFDITLLPILENAWYGVSKNKLDENIWYKNIILSKHKIELLNWVSIDLWSVGKWYMVDKIYKFLDKKYTSFVIDFGGDIRVKWKHTIALENPNDTSKILWKIILENQSIASSSGNRRKFWDSHHLINPKTGKSVYDREAIFLTHKLSCFSDIFSTALFVSPTDITIKTLNTVPWLEGMIIMSDWKIHKTKMFRYSIEKARIEK